MGDSQSGTADSDVKLMNIKQQFEKTRLKRERCKQIQNVVKLVKTRVKTMKGNSFRNADVIRNQLRFEMSNKGHRRIIYPGNKWQINCNYIIIINLKILEKNNNNNTNN